jgi:hypothetical protein
LTFIAHHFGPFDVLAVVLNMVSSHPSSVIGRVCTAEPTDEIRWVDFPFHLSKHEEFDCVIAGTAVLRRSGANLVIPLTRADV